MTLALASLLLATQLAAAPKAGGAATKYLQAAKQLYAEVEYEAALDQLAHARKAPGITPSEMVDVDIYSGLIQCDLGNWDAGRSAFRTALALNPDAELPKGVSPKIKVEWKLLQKQAAKHRPKRAPTEVATPAPEVKPAPAPEVKPQPTPEPALPPALAAAPTPTTPAGGLHASAETETTSRSPAPYFVLGGAAVLAAAGGTFGLLSSHASSSAKDEPVQLQAQAGDSSAHTQAMVANVCYGAAGLAATAGLIWLLAR